MHEAIEPRFCHVFENQEIPYESYNNVSIKLMLSEIANTISCRTFGIGLVLLDIIQNQENSRLAWFSNYVMPLNQVFVDITCRSSHREISNFTKVEWSKFLLIFQTWHAVVSFVVNGIFGWIIFVYETNIFPANGFRVSMQTVIKNKSDWPSFINRQPILHSVIEHHNFYSWWAVTVRFIINEFSTVTYFYIWFNQRCNPQGHGLSIGLKRHLKDL